LGWETLLLAKLKAKVLATVHLVLGWAILLWVKIKAG